MTSRMPLLALCFTIAGAPALAHHAISGIYDSSKRVTVEGAVREFQFINPHPFLIIEVSEDGKTPGALIGSHRVLLTDLNTISTKQGAGRDLDDGPIRKSRFPARYESSAATPLKMEVRAGENNVLDLDLTTP